MDCNIQALLTGSQVQKGLRLAVTGTCVYPQARMIRKPQTDSAQTRVWRLRMEAEHATVGQVIRNCDQISLKPSANRIGISDLRAGHKARDRR
jgi:hypothetical protein